MNITKKRIVYTIVVTLFVVFSTTFAILMTLERTDYRNYLQGEYSKNMYELITAVDNIRSSLTKSAIVGSREQGIVAFEEIFRYSSIANDKLHSLPIPQQDIDNTSKFLSQVGDFSNSLARSVSSGKDLEKSDYDTIERLKTQSVSLENQLNGVLSDINQGKVKWGEIRKKASSVFAENGKQVVSEKFADIQKQVAQYPALVYDGPFSDNVQEITPKINSYKTVSSKEAAEVAKKAVNSNRVSSIKTVQNSSKNTLPSYTFSIAIKGRKEKNSNVSCEVTKNGGKVSYLIDNRTIGKPTIDVNKAVEIGNKYLKGMGYSNMIPSYTLNYNNTAVVSYVYKQGSVMIYPDQIKLKVALDDGSVVGIESEKYLVSHVDKRNVAQPAITQKKAAERVGKNLKIMSSRLAIVPTESNKEVLCYEFTGNYKGDDFIVYINALTGYEQRILQIIDTPNGQLTM